MASSALNVLIFMHVGLYWVQEEPSHVHVTLQIAASVTLAN